MPCLKENYLVLQQSVTVDPAEVDALVTKIEETLQLHGPPGGHQRTGFCGAAVIPNLKQNPRSCCLKIRNQRGTYRTRSPYQLSTHVDQDWDQIRPWNRTRVPVRVQEEDPHRLLQELIISGNLIKEAVRRLQFSPDCRDLPRGPDSLPCV
ncbi:glycogen synthase kinase binding protein [Girardinichthys multiradiatus]|uniref:glycogen synthase kinase binding protein n=1 Tax=Girardinichthys multiradiatus TaxID=208333 RepID=UPI001FAC627A|nr:glycogen synthase kinase binding protein [Girardinichthys multiradiatus]